MRTPEDVKEWALRRIKQFTAELETATDEFEIETKLYTIMRTAEHGYQDVRGLITIARSQQ